MLKNLPKDEFNEFKRRVKYDWFHLKLNSMLQDSSRGLIKTGFRRIWDMAKIH